MRELEFLPAWYKQIHDRKRMVVLQSWLTGALLVGLGAYFFLANRNVAASQESVALLDNQLAEMHQQLQKLHGLRDVQKQFRQQDQVISKLGLHVEATRLLNTLDTVVPPEMTILDLSMDNEEQLRAPSLLLASPEALQKDPAVDRKLRVKLTGVTPTDIELANFLKGLTTVPFFEQLSMTYTRDRSDHGLTMREFEVTFVVNLTRSQGT
jgi:Tfp pilus assembly protein PilN